MKNSYSIRGNVVRVFLNYMQEALIDLVDLKLLEQVDTIYATRDETTRSYYAVCYINGELKKLHRLIMSPPNGMEVDHINRKTLDNRRKNLRIVNHSVNTHNQGTRQDNTSGFRGVSFVKHCNKYRARIQLDGKSVYLGLFSSPEDAAKVVEQSRNEYLKGVLA